MFSWDSLKQIPITRMAMQIRMHGRAKCIKNAAYADDMYKSNSHSSLYTHTAAHLCTWTSSAFGFKADRRRRLSPHPCVSFLQANGQKQHLPHTSIIYTQLIHSHVHTSERSTSQSAVVVFCVFGSAIGDCVRLVWLSWWRCANTCHRFDYKH